MIKSNLAMLALVTLPLFAAPKNLPAAPPQPSRTVSVDAALPLRLEFRDGRLSVEAREVELATLLIAVTERTGVTFKVSDGALNQNRVTVNIKELPLVDAVPKMLVDYNTLHVWDERMKLLQVNVLGRSVSNGATEVPVTETVAKKNHSPSPAPIDSARLEKALEVLRSEDNDRRLATLNEVVGQDDPRVAAAILDIALAGSAGKQGNPSGDLGSAGSESIEDGSKSQLAFEAAIALWRHGLERGFADQETVEALRTLEAKGNPDTSGLAKQALEHMQSNF